MEAIEGVDYSVEVGMVDVMDRRELDPEISRMSRPVCSGALDHVNVPQPLRRAFGAYFAAQRYFRGRLNPV